MFDILSPTAPANMSVLHDASCGLGIEITSLPAPSENIPCGYAGGIGPENIDKILQMVRNLEQPGEKKVWIDKFSKQCLRKGSVFKTCCKISWHLPLGLEEGVVFQICLKHTP